MDTDIEVLKNLDWFLEDDFFTAMENKHQVWWSIMWSIPKHPFAREILNYYEKTDIRIIITHLMTNILQKYWLKWSQEQTVNNIHIYKSKTFYPFAYYEKYSKNCITSETYTIHRFEATRLPKYITKIIFPIIWIRKKWF